MQRRSKPPSPVTLDRFARDRVAALLDRLSQQVAHVCQVHDADAIHDLRVSIRRLTQALRALRGLFRKRDIKPMRRQLRVMMNIAAEIRNRDIALELFQAAGVEASAPTCVALSAERDVARTHIVALAQKWHQEKLPASWKGLVQGKPL